MISSGESSVSLEDIYKVTTEAEIAHYYLGITSVPCKINSPLRLDRSPSFGLFSPNGSRITWIDFSSGERGGIFDLLGKMWDTNFKETLARIYKDLKKFDGSVEIESTGHAPMTPHLNIGNNDVKMECKIRDWKEHDIKYWKSYGISIEWLKYANVYPISHKIIIKNGQRYVFGADKYAYAYAEFKEGKTTLKIYQPYNKKGFKWANSSDRSVWSLWSKIPPNGDNLIISSSLKDCLNLWANLGIPSICMQGEGYLPKPHVIKELKRRFKNIIVFYDNDEPGEKDSNLLVEKFGLKKVSLPKELNVKDPSDCYKQYGKEKYLEIMKELIKPLLWKNGDL